MNTLDVYRKLPRTNCGECPEKRCMAFAVAVTKGTADVDSCISLEKSLADELKSIKPVDWRQDLIKSLQQDISEIDFSQIAAPLGAKIDGESLKFRAFGTAYRVSPTGEISTAGHINTKLQVLILLYLKRRGGSINNQWVSISDLRGGGIKVPALRDECEEPLRELIDRNLQGIEEALMALGAEKTEIESADHAWVLTALPKIPALIIYRGADKEVSGDSSMVKILYDSSADRMLDVESLVFLLEEYLEIVSSSIS